MSEDDFDPSEECEFTNKMYCIGGMAVILLFLTLIAFIWAPVAYNTFFIKAIATEIATMVFVGILTP